MFEREAIMILQIPRTPRRLQVAGFAAAGLILLSGCAAGSASDGTSDPTADLGDCGVLPTVQPNDPDGVLDQLPEDVSAAYNGYGGELQASPWADWKPDGPGPYDVAVVFSETGPPYQATLLSQTVANLEASDQIGEVTVTEAGRDVATQVSNFQAAIRSGADIILFQPLQSDALTPLIDQAAEAGIPSISMQGQSTSANAVDVVPNPFLLTAQPAAELVKLMGGEGTLLAVRGVPGVPIETEAFAGVEAIVSECPGITIDDSVVGNYSAATAKTEVQRYLTTHPGEIGGVINSALMGTGIVQAFVDAGRELPPIADPAMTEGFAAYWSQNRDSFQGIGSGQGAAAIAGVISDVTLRMLAGDGILINDVALAPPLVTTDNLDDWAADATDVQSSSSLEPPTGTYPPSGFLDGIFG
jgi:ribose transport system substrate-binding protein